jgi:chemotaxis protein MotB
MKLPRRSSPVNHDRWLVSYADFVTLLFAFFVVLYASAQVDRQRAVRLSGAIRSAFQELGVFQNENPQTGSTAGDLAVLKSGAAAQTPPAALADEAARKEQFNAIRHELGAFHRPRH